MFPFGLDSTEQRTILLHTSQLAILRKALANDPTYDEAEHMLIGMIDDALGDSTTEVFGFCY